ncbi:MULTISPECIES: molybdate ABC transporter substrate-binding protein [Thioclava]|uniref:Molybdate ABC transporter substrate-binding protein n=1 Tax=Thioclava kandeliae TaxID=3070818 RepID=A0ABV1SFZ9_9RHOB
MRALPLLALVACLTPMAASAEPVIFAAASMKTALDEIARDWAEDHDPVTISYAGSSKLARQIEAGAPADMFISASTDWMDQVETSGTIKDGSRHDLLGNALVLVAHDNVKTAPQDLPEALGKDGFLAMALVDSVPAGIYGKQALTHLGLWDQLSSHVAQADNVRAALALVATGESPYGVVYATDAHAEKRVHIAATFPEDSHDAITYPVALLTTGSDTEGAKAFLDYLSSPTAVGVFEAQGFSVKH